MRENEARPPAATAIPVIPDTRTSGGAPNPSAEAGGRSGAPATATAAPAGGDRRERRPRIFSRGLFGVLHRLINAVKHLSPRDRIRLLTGVLLVAALCAIVAVSDRITNPGIILFAVVAATLVMIVDKGKDGGLKKAGLILTFAITIVVIQAIATGRQTTTVAHPVPGPGERRLISGTVVDQTDLRPLAGVLVRTKGDGVPVQTDSLGRFSLGVLENSIQDGVVVFYLKQDSKGTIVSQPVTDAGVTLVFRTSVAQAGPGERALPREGSAPALLLLARLGGDGMQGQNRALAVIVDSIQALNDGTGFRGAEWSFDVKVANGTPIHISKSTYSERGQGRLMLVGSETDVSVRSGETVTITVNGVREVFFWKYRVKGSLPVAYEAVPADQPLRRHVVVQDGNRGYNGQFQFFLTVLRLPDRPAPG
jgi:hypothetical protein